MSQLAVAITQDPVIDLPGQSLAYHLRSVKILVGTIHWWGHVKYIVVNSSNSVIQGSTLQPLIERQTENNFYIYLLYSSLISPYKPIYILGY